MVVEKLYPPKTPPQCHSCLFHQYIQGYCNHVPRFVRCGEEHRSGVCTKSPNSPSRCALATVVTEPIIKAVNLNFPNSQTQQERVILASKTKGNFPKSTSNLNFDKPTICLSYFL